MWLHSHKHENSKDSYEKLARFSLYNSPAWLKTCSYGADVVVMPRSS